MARLSGARQALAETKRRGAEALLAAAPLPGGGEAGWAREARAAARARLLEMGAPSRRDEYFRYTDPASLIAAEVPDAPADIAEDDVFGDIARVTLTFIDGEFRPELSDDPAEAGLEIEPLASALATDIHWARDLFGRLEAAGQDPVARPLAAFNTAVAGTGTAIRATGAVARPVAFRYIHRSPTSDAMLRHLIRVEAGAELTVIETGPAAARVNICIETSIGDGGAFHHVRAQGRDHGRRAASAIFARLGAESTLKSFTLTANGALTRNEAVIEFTGDDATAHIAGAAMGDGAFVHDDTVFVTHDAERCESRQVFKKVLRHGAVGIFQGKILVKPGAQKTDGYQISQALLLDEQSQFNAKPELEIYADDVQCSHGSTSGSVDETALFYLRSRGLPLDEARDLLVQAFLEEAMQEIDDPALAEAVRAQVAGWMARRRG